MTVTILHRIMTVTILQQNLPLFLCNTIKEPAISIEQGFLGTDLVPQAMDNAHSEMFISKWSSSSLSQLSLSTYPRSRWLTLKMIK